MLPTHVHLIGKIDHIISIGKVRFNWNPLIGKAIGLFPLERPKTILFPDRSDRFLIGKPITSFPLEDLQAIADRRDMYYYMYVYISTFSLLIAKKGSQAENNFLSRAFSLLLSLPGNAIRRFPPSDREAYKPQLWRSGRNLPDRTVRSGLIRAITTFPLEKRRSMSPGGGLLRRPAAPCRAVRIPEVAAAAAGPVCPACHLRRRS